MTASWRTLALVQLLDIPKVRNAAGVIQQHEAFPAQVQTAPGGASVPDPGLTGLKRTTGLGCVKQIRRRTCDVPGEIHPAAHIRTVDYIRFTGSRWGGDHAKHLLSVFLFLKTAGLSTIAGAVATGTSSQTEVV